MARHHFGLYAEISALLVIFARAASMSTHTYNIHIIFTYVLLVCEANCSIVTTALIANWCFSEDVSQFDSEYQKKNAPHHNRARGVGNNTYIFLSDNHYHQHEVTIPWYREMPSYCNSIVFLPRRRHHMYACTCPAAIRVEISLIDHIFFSTVCHFRYYSAIQLGNSVNIFICAPSQPRER